MEKSYVITTEQHVLRIFCAIILWILGLMAIVSLTRFFLDSYYWGLFLGTAIWILMVGETIEAFMVSVPPFTGLIMMNPFVHSYSTASDPHANQAVYPVGLWFKFPWEQALEHQFIDLQFVSQEYEGTFTAKDGPRIEIRGSIIYRPRLAMLPRYTAVEDTVVGTWLPGVATGTLLGMISTLPASEARTKIPEFQMALAKELTGPMKALNPSEATRLRDLGLVPSVENLFGLDFFAVPIANVKYGAQYQEVLTQQARSVLVNQLVKTLMEEGDMDYRSASDVALLQFGIIKKKIYSFEVPGVTELVSTLIGRFGGGSANK